MTDTDLSLSLDINELILTVIFAILLIYSFSFVCSNELILVMLMNCLLNRNTEK
ncbi:MAG: hypothetical protein IJ104_10540 [Methanobrevibacter sp.]|nr:hypothetical protein [Methanobrevibacter sp.]